MTEPSDPLMSPPLSGVGVGSGSGVAYDCCEVTVNALRGVINLRRDILLVVQRDDEVRAAFAVNVMLEYGEVEGFTVRVSTSVPST